MAKLRSRHKVVIAVVVLAAGLLALIVGVPVYVVATAKPLHAEPRSAPSVARPALSQQWSDPVDRARYIIRTALAEQNLPGLSGAVGAGGDLVWAEGFGWADVESRTPVTPETRFRIGPASKVLTSAAVGVLLEQERLKLEEQIQTYVPQFPRTEQPVTLRQVMGHVAGIGTDSEDDRPLSRQRCEQPIEAVRQFADQQLLFEPGSEYRYSNYGWILVSAAVEEAVDQPFLTFMQNRIFEPLGMRDTGAESAKEENPERIGEAGEDAPPITLFRQLILQPLVVAGPKEKFSAVTPGLATLYARGFGSGPVFRHRVHVMPPRNLSCYAGSMAFFSTPSDLVRLSLAVDTGTLVTPATAQLLQTSQRLTSGQQTGHGLGWHLETVTLARKSAQGVGYSSEPSGRTAVTLMSFREHGIVVAVTSNISHANTSDVALRVAAAFAEQARR